MPPSVNAELADGLLNLHNDIEKWEVLEDGALKEKFRAAISQQARGGPPRPRPALRPGAAALDDR